MKNKKSSFLETFLPLVILAVSILFIIFNIIVNMDGVEEVSQSKSVTHQTSSSITEIVEKISPITNTKEYYNVLMGICYDYINNNDLNYSVVDTDIAVEENIYVDEGISSKIVYDEPTDFEIEPIYFQNKVLVRYENELGEIKGVLAESKKDGVDNFLVILNPDTSDLLEIHDVCEQGSLKNPNGSILEYSLVDSNGYFNSEYTRIDLLNVQMTYLNDLAHIFCHLVQKNLNEEDLDLNYDIMDYFTEESYENIVVSDTYIKSGSDVSVSYIIIGSSDIDTLKYNRVFLKLVVDDVDVNIVVKLNDVYKIYDIDIF